MSFTPRLSRPAYNNKYYISKRTGGYNPCIYGNNTSGQRDKYLNVLPNCVGWTVGRFNEVIGQKNCNYLGSTNACNMIVLAKKQGLFTGILPKVGAVIVWSGGDGYGHVGNVEQVISDSEIVISQSGWNYKGANNMWTSTHKKGANGSWIYGGDYAWMSKKKKPYKFEGFIYNPAVMAEEFEEDDVVLDPNFTVRKDGKLMHIPAGIQNGVTIAALKNTLETLGYADVTWDDKNKMVVIKTKK